MVEVSARREWGEGRTHGFERFDDGAPGGPAGSSGGAEKRHGGGRGEGEVDDDFLLVEAFARVDADDDQAAEGADKESVERGVGRFEVEGVRRRGGEVVGVGTVDLDSNCGGREEGTRAGELDANVGRVGCEEDCGGEVI